MSKINVLIFPAGEINSIELHDALSTCVNINLFGASSVERHGSYVFKNYIPGLPFINSNDFFYKFNEIIEKNNITLVFPTHDSVALFLVENQDKCKAKILAGNIETVRICRDKRKTYELFKECSFLPKIYNSKREVDKLPVFIKPREGQGSVGALKIMNVDDLKDEWFNDYVVSEFLPGDEFTVDCITDKNGKLQYVSPRSRQRLLAGVCVSGQNEMLSQEIERIANTINDRMSFLGLWYFQIKKDNQGIFKLLEISTRCAGTMCLTRVRGVNLPLLSIYAAMGKEISVFANNYNVKMDRTLISRYKIDYDYDNVYIDYDDTVIINDAVNLTAIRFLYQCQNYKKNVYIITKHEFSLIESLEKYSIPKTLFKSIMHLKTDEQKVDFIDPSMSIFIDNSFQERKIVYEKLKIPVFDVDGIEVLLDWRS